MRGKGRDFPRGMRAQRITPAYAGKSNIFFHFAAPPRDHPRTCGEKFSGRLPATTATGSPPHMRGKVPIFADPQEWDRITPAHAGKRAFITSRRHPDRDHPRTCGEKVFRPLFHSIARGSPPHMRGKEQAGFNARQNERITPAHAGKRFLLPSRCALPRDHPRTCREKFRHPYYTTPKGGSPPHMRGKEDGRVYPRLCVGITPALAGKSGSCRWCSYGR